MDKYLDFQGSNLFPNLQTKLLTWFSYFKHSSFSHNVDYVKKYERQSDVKNLVTAFQNFICSILIKVSGMAFDQILNLKQISREARTK